MPSSMAKLLHFACFACIALKFTVGTCSSEDKLNVFIDVNYTAPGGFFLKPPYYRAASSLTLTCRVEGLQGALTYNWTSDCTGGCFTQGETTQSVEKFALQSTDSGFHTCTVTDPGGCTGNATVEVKVTGIGMYLNSNDTDELPGSGFGVNHYTESNGGILPANALIFANYYGNVPGFTCLSSSKKGNVGQLIGVDGRDITDLRDDHFSVKLGDDETPGSLSVHHTRYAFTNQGVYTCRLPDESGNIVSINFGLHTGYFYDTPWVTDLVFDGRTYPFTLTCTSTGSPPTTIVWKKNNKEIAIDGSVFTLKQTVINRRAATFKSMLRVYDEYANMIGNYSCSVANTLGVSESKTIDLTALQVTGHEHPLIVGLEPVINCSTYLNVTRLEWLLVGFDIALESSTSQILPLPLDLTSDGLDGAMFRCRATTNSHGTYEEIITIAVKELDNIISIKTPQMPLPLGQPHTLDCVVHSDITPQVKWMGPDGGVLVGDRDIIIGNPVELENGTVIISLTFANLHTSQAGEYTCQSVVQNPPSVESHTQAVAVQVPTPTVTVRRTPNDSTLYAGTQVILTCTIELNGGAAVDTGVTVSTTWDGPSGVLTTGGRVTVSTPTIHGGYYESTLSITSLQSSDDGTYNCSAVVSPNTPSLYITESASLTVSSNFDVELNVTIAIDYSPPAGVTARPPNYSPAIPVTLRCVAVGTSGNVSYQWSSTCSGCFVSGSSQTVSRSYLWSYDAGQHTCVTTDGAGNTGRASIQMNIIGGGMYIKDRSSYVAISNNSAVLWGSSTSYYYELDLYCMSNSSSTSVSAYIQYPYSSSRFSTAYCGAGCYRLYSSYSYLSSSYKGIFTCRIQDSRGIYLDIHVGIYYTGFNYAPVVTSLQNSTSSTQFTLICTSTTSPATTVMWTKDGNTLTMDGSPYQHSQVITDRRSSIYNNMLTSTGDRASTLGNYTCTVSNRFGSSSRNAMIKDLQVSITILYSPPAGVTVRPPNYRPATSVSLRCDAVGTSGSVRYQWSSTCSGCFVSGSSQTVSRSYLWSYDAGNHTCVVTDEAGNTGRATTEMNIIGAGMYAATSLYSNNVPLSNNSAIVWTSYYTTTHYNLYCMSNSSSTYASVVYPYSSGYMSRTSCGAGCYRLYYNDYRASLSSSYQGIYTCRIKDSRGVYLDVSTGIYPYGFDTAPVVTGLYQTAPPKRFAILCTSTNSPATIVVWTKEGRRLTKDGGTYRLTQIVTDRRASTYDNIFTPTGTLDSVVGSYTCNVSNRFGYSSKSISIRGLEISGAQNFTVGNNVTLSCLTDIDEANSVVEWIRHHHGNITLATSTGVAAVLELNMVTLSMHEVEYICRSSSSIGSQERKITVNVEVPDAWGTVDVEAVTAPREGYDYGLLCRVVLSVDLEATPELVWWGPDGYPVSNGSNITVGVTQSLGMETSLALKFMPLNSTHGGNYSCKVTVSVPYVNLTLTKVVMKSLVVTTQAAFQFKFGPVQQCIYWSLSKAADTDLAIRNALVNAINDRCDCDFQIAGIFDGDFSCQTMMKSAVYRSKINGTSDKHTATELLAFIQDWIMTEGTFVVNKLRLRVNKTCSPFRLQSFHQPECTCPDSAPTPAHGDDVGESAESYFGGCIDQCLENQCSSLSSEAV